MNPNLTVIEEKLRSKGLKKNWVAEQLKVHPSTFRRFLNGQAELGLEQLATLLKILDLKFEALIDKAS